MQVSPLLSILALPLSFLFSIIIKIRGWLYKKGLLKSHKLPGVTISIGNIEVGGTGKTPVVLTIAEHLLKLNYQPVILTRGYRSGLKGYDSMVLRGEETLLAPLHKGAYYPDEARMQSSMLKQVPVILGRVRWQAARRYLEHFPAPTHWILDDGFQHLKIKRDIDIVLLDAKNPFHNGRLLPAGRLRESPAALTRADFVIFTRCTNMDPSSENKTAVKLHVPELIYAYFLEGAPVQVAGPNLDFSKLKHLAIVAAIAKPQIFERKIHSLKIQVKARLYKRDHERFFAAELNQLIATVDGIVTTAKDYWRDPVLFQDLQKPVFVIPLQVQMPISALDKISGLS